MNKTFKALRNGYKCEAYKDSNGRWNVGGDFPYPNDAILIVSNKADRLAWFALKGCCLVFQDFCGENEYQNIGEPI